MTETRFNQLLNGPLGHPLPMFRVSRLALALRSVLMSCGKQAEDALEQHCKERQAQDEANEGGYPDCDN